MFEILAKLLFNLYNERTFLGYVVLLIFMELIHLQL